ncbi:hypothetical protein HZS_7758 [Henneguya salminicola]|nr:hypothetical protein HZS_7758 [Henneguya salminicola]
MTRISTIILISLISSCIDNIVCEQKISYKFQNNNDLVLDEIFNGSMYIKNIVQSSRPMFLDIAIMLTKNACNYCRPKFPNARAYLTDLFRTASGKHKEYVIYEKTKRRNYIYK